MYTKTYYEIGEIRRAINLEKKNTLIFLLILYGFLLENILIKNLIFNLIFQILNYFY